MGIDIENNLNHAMSFLKEKKKVVKELKTLAQKNEEVLAGWMMTAKEKPSVGNLCGSIGLDPNKTKRIVFHEITKPAIKEAVENPRLLDMNLVKAQQARRVLDRIVGFELSPYSGEK